MSTTGSEYILTLLMDKCFNFLDFYYYFYWTEIKWKILEKLKTTVGICLSYFLLNSKNYKEVSPFWILMSIITMKLLSYDHSLSHYYLKHVKTIITLKLFSWNIFSIHCCLLHLVVMFSDMKVRNICAANAKAKEKANYSGSRLSYSQVIRPEHICWHLEGVIRYFVTRKNINRNTFDDWSFVVVTFL